MDFIVVSHNLCKIIIVNLPQQIQLKEFKTNSNLVILTSKYFFKQFILKGENNNYIYSILIRSFPRNYHIFKPRRNTILSNEVLLCSMGQS